MIILITAFVFLFIVLVLLFLLRKNKKSLIPDGSQFAQISDINLHYTVAGNGRNILLLHGIAANVYCWRFLIPLLAKTHRVWALDLKGFGLSDKPQNSDYGLPAQAELVADFIQGIIEEKCLVIGSSMGGAIAMELALMHPQTVEKLILLSPAYDSAIVKYNPSQYKFLLPFARLLANPIFVKSVVKSLYGKKIKIPQETVDAYLKPYIESPLAHNALMESFSALTDPTLKDRISSLTHPTLLIWGKLDGIVPLNFAAGARDKIPSSQLIVHDEGGHHLQEEEPEWLSEQILKFE